MKRLLFILIPLIGLIASCGKEVHDDGHGHLLEKITSQTKELSYEITTKEEIDTFNLLTVHANINGVKDFYIDKRSAEITSFPCSNCHNKPLDQLKSKKGSDTKKSHWNVHMKHAEVNTMNCVTCHSQDNMDNLVSLTGQTISIDESYKLCAQCHSTQYKDWQGGAHGKQLNGWSPPRVAKTCVSCHSPHEPSFPSRFPARLNTNDLGTD